MRVEQYGKEKGLLKAEDTRDMGLGACGYRSIADKSSKHSKMAKMLPRRRIATFAQLKLGSKPLPPRGSLSPHGGRPNIVWVVQYQWAYVGIPGRLSFVELCRY